MFELPQPASPESGSSSDDKGHLGHEQRLLAC